MLNLYLFFTSRLATKLLTFYITLTIILQHLQGGLFIPNQLCLEQVE